VAGYIPRWYLSTDGLFTNPSTNWTRRRVTTLINTNTLPLSHATTAKWLAEMTGTTRVDRSTVTGEIIVENGEMVTRSIACLI